MLIAACAMLAILPVAFWAGGVGDGVAISATRRGPIAQSTSSTADADAANDERVTQIRRMRAARTRRRREQREFRAWLEITAEPLW